MARLSLKALSKHFGTAVAVQHVDLDVGDGELVALLGPSGCGKTTTLRMVAGFIAPTAGQILIGEQDVTRAPPYERDTGMVFQSYALFPHMTVAQNVSFGLEMRKVGRAEREQRVREALQMVRLDHLAERLPRELSGGQQQRVALARALAVNPAVFLLDEPLSNLDAKLRAEVRLQIRALQQRLGLTTLIVTHDQEEALTMADRLVVMDQGRVKQIGTAEELYERPADAFVAGFVGRCNLIAGTQHPEGFCPQNSLGLLPVQGVSGRAIFALRPERVTVEPDSGGDGAGDTGAGEGVAGQVSAITYLGSQTEYHVDVAGNPMISIQPTPQAGDRLKQLRPGDRVRLRWNASDVRLLPFEDQSNQGEEP
jgi:putative spermidine/putrescine transport system ATP-binding protein